MLFPWRHLLVCLCIAIVIIRPALSWRLRQYSSHRLFQQSATNDAVPDCDAPIIKVYPTEADVGSAICADIVKWAQLEIDAKGKFCIAVPSAGAVLKKLKGLVQYKDEIDWSKVYLFYVDHKCVALDDPTAAHTKAREWFLDALTGIRAFPPGYDSDAVVRGHDTDAHEYTKHLKDNVPHHDHHLFFDYILLSVGKDGHIGGLFPNSKELAIDDRWVVPVDMKSSLLISLSLPVINYSKNVRIVATGEEKGCVLQTMYGSGSSHREISSFPVSGVQPSDGTQPVWMVDEKCGKSIDGIVPMEVQ